MTDWRDIIGASGDVSYNADVEWTRRVPEPDQEEQIAAEDPQWTPPPDLWRPASTLGEISTDPPAASG